MKTRISTIGRLTRGIFLTLFVFLGNTSAHADEGEATENLAAEVKEILRANCAECHSEEDARADVRVFDHAGLLEAEHIVPHKPDGSHLYQLITSTDDDVMPPSSRPSLTAQQITAIRKWIAMGAAAFPLDVSTAADPARLTATPSPPLVDSQSGRQPYTSVKPILDTILEHYRDTDKSDRPFLRYFSLRHLLDAGITADKLEEHRVAFAKAINHLSREREICIPIPIDPPRTVLAVDLRKLGWHRPLLRSMGDESQTINLHDLVLLEYPYAIIPGDSDTFDQLETELFAETKQLRSIAFVRADWFCSVVLQPPLYHDMLQLPQTLEELEAELNVDVASHLESGVAQRAGMTVSGVSRNNRVVERHPQRDGYYWKSHDFQSNIGSENILKDPINFRPSGGEMIFRLPNGMQAYYVCDGRGRRLNAAPTSIVVDKFASDRVVKNGLGCMRCHNQGIKDFHDSVRDVLLTLSGTPGFDKRRALRLYPSSDSWDKTVDSDQQLFLMAVAKLGDNDSHREPLAGITADYLEGTLTLAEAAAEIGVDATQLKISCRAPGFTRLGLAPLASGGVIRRDAWEDNFDAAATLLGKGTPVVAIDGNLRKEYVPTPELDGVELRTNKINGFFEPGDQLRITVENNSGNTIYFEVYGTSIEDKKVRITKGVESLEPAKSFAFPESDGEFIEVRGGLGGEEIMMFASTQAFSPGQIFRGKNVADRVVHRFFDKTDERRRDASDIVKKTILIETK